MGVPSQGHFQTTGKGRRPGKSRQHPRTQNQHRLGALVAGVSPGVPCPGPGWSQGGGLASKWLEEQPGTRGSPEERQEHEFDHIHCEGFMDGPVGSGEARSRVTGPGSS